MCIHVNLQKEQFNSIRGCRCLLKAGFPEVHSCLWLSQFADAELDHSVEYCIHHHRDHLEVLNCTHAVSYNIGTAASWFACGNEKSEWQWMLTEHQTPEIQVTISSLWSWSRSKLWTKLVASTRIPKFRIKKDSSTLGKFDLYIIPKCPQYVSSNTTVVPVARRFTPGSPRILL